MFIREMDHFVHEFFKHFKKGLREEKAQGEVSVCVRTELAVVEWKYRQAEEV